MFNFLKNLGCYKTKTIIAPSAPLDIQRSNTDDLTLIINKNTNDLPHKATYRVETISGMAFMVYAITQDDESALLHMEHKLETLLKEIRTLKIVETNKSNIW